MRITVKVRDLLSGDVLCGSGYVIDKVYNNFVVPRNRPDLRNKAEVIYHKVGDPNLWKSYWGKNTTMTVERS